jgi:sulfur carrier protein ThiS
VNVTIGVDFDVVLKTMYLDTRRQRSLEQSTIVYSHDRVEILHVVQRIALLSRCTCAGH